MNQTAAAASPTLRLQGKVALVTGAAGGIGQAIVNRLAENGAAVVMSDTREEESAALVAGWRSRGIDISFLAQDVTNESDWSRVVERVVETHGRLDVLVNNAGVSARQGQPFEDISVAEWQRVMLVNLQGAFLGTRAGIRAMRPTGSGSIVNIGSIAGIVGTRGGAAYGASKAGVHALTRQAAYSCGKRGLKIRVNTIVPGYVWTDLVAQSALKEFGSKENAIAALAARNLLGRLNEPDDIAWAVVFLASEEARQITGIELPIDAGQLVG